MAARRLLILLLVLFGFSALAAALIPVPPPVERAASPAEETEARPNSRVLERSIHAEARRPAVIRLGAEDFLSLVIRARRVAQVEIPRLGVLEDVGPHDPATLELAPPQAGSYAIRLVDTGRLIATLEVVPASGCCRRG